MLSLFPQLLFLTPLAITVLRVSAGLVFLSLAWGHYSDRARLGETSYLVVGKGTWIPIFSAFVELAVAVALIVGAYTQLAAIVGALIAFKQLIWRRRYPQFFSLQTPAAFLLMVICLALIVTGAGALAFDLPF